MNILRFTIWFKSNRARAREETSEQQDMMKSEEEEDQHPVGN